MHSVNEGECGAVGAYARACAHAQVPRVYTHVVNGATAIGRSADGDERRARVDDSLDGFEASVKGAVQKLRRRRGV